MLMDDRHYKLLHQLENEFGGLDNVPEDNYKLLAIRNFLSKREPRRRAKRDTSESQISYDVEISYNICCDRAKGMKMADIAEDYDLALTTVANILNVYGMKRTRTFIATLEREGKRFVSMNYKDIIKRVRRFAAYKKLSEGSGRLLIQEGRKYRGSLTLESVDTYPEIDKEKIKEIAYLRRINQKSLKNRQTAITFLNKINGEGFYTDEDTVRWASR